MAHYLGEQHRQRVSFLTARTAWNPDPDFLTVARIPDQLCDGLFAERIEIVRITEELCYVDQQVLEKRLAFIGIGPDTLDVIKPVLDRKHLHPPGHPPHEGGALVTGEIMSDRFAQHLAQLVNAVGDHFSCVLGLIRGRPGKEVRNNFYNVTR